MPEGFFPVADVSDWDVVGDETTGAEEKYWLRKPDTEQRWLFKAVTVKSGHVHGEDWSETSAAHLAALLGVPCALVQMARLRTTHGCIVRDLRPPECELQHGRTLLEENDAPGYVHRAGGITHPGHSLENIQAVLKDALPPPGCDLPFGAFDVFAGYLTLDAWIANRDRHDTNWAVLRPITSSDALLRLCGSYDHASSLGFNLLDDKREQMLADRDGVSRWCGRGTAWRFDHLPGTTIPSLVEVAAKALRLASPDARDHWVRQMATVSDDDVRNVISRVPEMSDLARRFALTVLSVNRRRVLDAAT